MSRNDSKSAPSQGRREFLKAGGALTAALLAPVRTGRHAEIDARDCPRTRERPAAMPTRNLGKTGYKVGIFSLGGQASLEKANNFDVAVPDCRKGARSRRELHRYIFDLWRPGAMERAVRGQGDGPPAQ